MLEIKIDESFNLKKTLECGQCFHYLKEKDEYIVFGENSVCRASQNKDILTLDTTDYEAWKKYFALDEQYSNIIKYLVSFSKENDDLFSLQSINKGCGIRILRQPLFETCCSFILSQQNNIPRIQKMIFTLSEKYSSNTAILHGVKYSCFPSPEDLSKVSIEAYKAIGFGYRAEYIYNFIKIWSQLKNSLSGEYSKDKEILMSCKGIGTKVADCICLYGLHELDAFPIDTWMKKIINEEYKEKGKELIIPSQYAGILQQFMFDNKRNP